MWNWLKRRSLETENASLREQVETLSGQRDKLIGQVEGARELHTQLCMENAELRALVVTLDNACADLSIKLYGRGAVDRVIAQHRRSGIN